MLIRISFDFPLLRVLRADFNPRTNLPDLVTSLIWALIPSMVFLIKIELNEYTSLCYVSLLSKSFDIPLFIYFNHWAGLVGGGKTMMSPKPPVSGRWIHKH